MKCKFCDKDVTHKIKFFGGMDREIIRCDNHKPVKVHYKSLLNGDHWFITYNNYRLMYWNGRTFLQKINSGAESARDYIKLIKKFDYELKILPEQFDRKLKTMLTFL